LAVVSGAFKTIDKSLNSKLIYWIRSDEKKYLDELVALGGVYWDKANNLLTQL